MKISIAIPTIGESPYLAETLSKLSESIHLDIIEEIILVDNGSNDSDSIIRLVDQVPTQKTRLVRHKERLTINENWNACLEHAASPFVHILHDDDFILPGFYEEVSELYAEAPDLGFYATRCFSVNESSIIEGCFPKIPRRLTKENFHSVCRPYANNLQCPGIVIDRNKLIELGGFSSSYPYVLDMVAWTELICKYGAAVSDQVLACYRIHQSNATAMLKKNSIDLYDRLQYAKKYYPTDAQVLGQTYRSFIHEAELASLKFPFGPERNNFLKSRLSAVPLKYRLEHSFNQFTQRTARKITG